MFQSTPPHGGDATHLSHFVTHSPRCFNPRPRTGATPHSSARGREASCFNPRPRTGATYIVCHIICRLMFQSTPPHGGDIYRYVCLENRRCFNPRPRTGATLSFLCSFTAIVAMFQSTPPHGGDGFPFKIDCNRVEVSIHAPVRGRPPLPGLAPAGTGFNPRPRTGATVSQTNAWESKYKVTHFAKAAMEEGRRMRPWRADSAGC